MDNLARDLFAVSDRPSKSYEMINGQRIYMLALPLEPHRETSANIYYGII
jgi:hypothetical protein